VSGLITKNCYL